MKIFEQSLSHDKTKIDQYISKVSNELMDDAKTEHGATYRDVLAAYIDVLSRGGGRLRGVLAKRAYEFYGGQNESVALEAAAIVEMLHDYLLVIDDIEDESDLRRGKPAAHILLEHLHESHQLAGDRSHFGVSQAINAALIGQNLALLRALKLPVDDSSKVVALTHLNDLLAKTGFGQMGDFNNEAFATNKEADVLQVLQLKTAYYTFCMPVYFGAALAGTLKVSSALNRYLINTGVGFQLYDDIIGTFGDIQQTGKSNRSDIIEGKRTLLIVYALETANGAQKTALSSALGNKNLTDAEFEAAQKAIRDTGALKRCQEKAHQLVAQANQELKGASDLSSEAVEFFTSLAQYIASSAEV
ncbi:MAG: polyprenyl synthetase family protein [Candidatus Nomurabacteria bacterium]|jgi:geranylgeranyl diphosphate synthase type I|nr:polyprenyl synthetase family protein [Candidatus Nomurabacteria bacterium]